MKVCLFDTETNGFPDYRKEPNAITQPYLLELGAELLEVPPNPDDAVMIEALNELVLIPPGIKISEACRKVHGITETDLIMTGVQPVSALTRWGNMIRQADVVVCFNVQFDAFIMRTAHLRAGMELPTDLRLVQVVCAMTVATRAMPPLPFPNGGTGKFANLDEAFAHYTGSDLGRTRHAAIDDVRATRRIFFEQIRRGNVQLKGRK